MPSYQREFRDPALARGLVERIHGAATAPVTIMEVCGTHTTSIFRNGIKSLLPEAVTLLSGPGCPVCVTPQGEIDAVMELALRKGVILATFGDLLRVPGRHGSLYDMRAQGADVRMVYSPMDAVTMAAAHPDREVVFVGIGFETTAPTTALALLEAKRHGLPNFSLLSLHKRTPPAISAVLDGSGSRIDALLLPGHVSVIIGEKGFQKVMEKRAMPAAITGFEPVDILGAILALVRMGATQTPSLTNLYGRAVQPDGNPKALEILKAVFQIHDASWRGMGPIPRSGLAIREPFSAFDAGKKFAIDIKETPPPPGCRCGEILTARNTPAECPLFGTRCTPGQPVGPCMVSSEGSCAAAYKYG